MGTSMDCVYLARVCHLPLDPSTQFTLRRIFDRVSSSVTLDSCLGGGDALGPAPRDGFRLSAAGMTDGGWGSGGKRKPRSTSAYGRPGGQPGSFGARRLHGFRKRNPGGRPLRVKPFTLQTPHQSVYHQYPIDHLLSECKPNINAIAVRAQYRSGANFGCC